MYWRLAVTPLPLGSHCDFFLPFLLYQGFPLGLSGVPSILQHLQKALLLPIIQTIPKPHNFLPCCCVSVQEPFLQFLNHIVDVLVFKAASCWLCEHLGNLGQLAAMSQQWTSLKKDSICSLNKFWITLVNTASTASSCSFVSFLDLWIGDINVFIHIQHAIHNHIRHSLYDL